MLFRCIVAVLTFVVWGCHAVHPVCNLQKHWFRTRLDHFNFRNTSSTFSLRYYVCDDYFYKSTSPVFFYTGNEADILQFANNTGFMIEAAQEFGALVVFAEHRYYGESMPFDNDKSLLPDNIHYLTVEQAMADYNMLNVYLRNNSPWSHLLSSSTPIVAFGGSYGANLAMWLRLQHSHLWAGAIASSATPLKHLLRNTNDFARIETEVYGNISKSCPDLVRRGWRELYQSSRQHVEDSLGLCPHSVVARESNQEFADSIHDWISNALETMAQYGYPYPTSFYNPVPAYPFWETCHRMLQAKTDLGALRAAAGVYYNWTGQAGSCFDVALDRTKHLRRHYFFTQNDSTSTVYQPMPTNGITDFEIPYRPNQTAYFEDCRRKWGVEPRPDWEEDTFGGADISAGSNIFITNGQLDPWRAGGIQTVPAGSPTSIVVRTIQDGAHHLDLRGSHPDDPPSVIQVRTEQKAAMHEWIVQWRRSHPSQENVATKTVLGRLNSVVNF